MSKRFSEQIAEQFDAIENENHQLKEQLKDCQRKIDKLIDSILKEAFNLDRKSLQKVLDTSSSSHSNFESEICKYYGLNSDEEKADYLRIMLSKSALNYYKKNVVLNSEQSNVGVAETSTSFITNNTPTTPAVKQG